MVFFLSLRAKISFHVYACGINSVGSYDGIHITHEAHVSNIMMTSFGCVRKTHGIIMKRSPSMASTRHSSMCMPEIASLWTPG
eukprot:71233-Pelagomonas_calceolata.AAC.2